jgi:hypothetical protein
MKRVLTIAVVVLLTAAAQPQIALNAAPPASSVTAGTVKVTIHYKGKGKVDGSHKLWVWLFDSPNIGAGSMPIGQIALDKNDTDAVFDGLAAGKVYVAVAFDETGAMMGDAPPPTGTPIGILMGSDGAPSAVTPDGTAPVALTFDDSLRMP